MADFDFVVDTSPMASSIDGMSGRVNATTAAVAAMQAAVIASEQAAAETISRNVDQGFYSLINSQVSMKKAEAFTAMNAKLALMLEFAKALSQAKNRMEADYNRLRREYYKIFHGLDKALENRVRQLDSPAMKLADTKMALVSDRFLKDSAELHCINQEIAATKQMAISARLKNKTRKTLNSLDHKIRETKEYTTQMDELMDPQGVDHRFEENIPVAFSREQSMVMRDSYVTKLHYPSFLSEAARNTIELNVLSQAESALTDTNDMGEKNEIAREFMNLVAQSGCDERMSQIIVWLFQNGGRR